MPFLSSSQAAKRLFVSSQTLRRWESQGILSSAKTPGGHRRYDAAAIDRLVGQLAGESPVSVPVTERVVESKSALEPTENHLANNKTKPDNPEELVSRSKENLEYAKQAASSRAKIINDDVYKLIHQSQNGLPAGRNFSNKELLDLFYKPVLEFQEKYLQEDIAYAIKQTLASGVAINSSRRWFHYTEAILKNQQKVTLSNIQKPLATVVPTSEDFRVVKLGKIQTSGKQVEYGIKQKDLNRHTAIYGRSFTGKTEMVRTMVNDVVQDNYPLFVLDTNGNLLDHLIDDVALTSRAKDAVWFDFTDSESVLEYNILDVPEQDVALAVNKVRELLEGFDVNLTARSSEWLEASVVALCKANLTLTAKASIDSIITFYEDLEFRRFIVLAAGDPSVNEAFDPENGMFEMMSDKQQKEQVSSFTRALRNLVAAPMCKPLLANSNKMNWSSILGAKSIVFIKVGNLDFEQQTQALARMVTYDIVSKTKQYGRQYSGSKMQGIGTRLFVDEIEPEAFDSERICRQLGIGEKYDFGAVFVANGNSNAFTSVLKSCANKIVFRADYNQTLANAMSQNGKTLGANDFPALPNFYFYAQTLMPLVNNKDNSTLSDPYLAESMMLPYSDDKHTEKLKNKKNGLAITRAEFDETKSKRTELIKQALIKTFMESVKARTDAKDDWSW